MVKIRLSKSFYLSHIFVVCITTFFLFGCGAKTKMNDNLKNFQFTCVQEKDRFPPFEP